MKLLSGVVGLLALSGAARAGTTLASIPIADILRHREVTLMHTVQSWEQTKNQAFHYSMATVGLYDRVEVGVSTDYLGTTAADFKVLLAEGNTGAASAGVSNVTARNLDWFVVGRYDMVSTRFHAGVFRTGGAALLVLGADQDLGHNGCLMLDYTSGPDNGLWGGWAIDAAPGVNVMAAYGRNRLSGASIYFNVTFGFSF